MSFTAHNIRISRDHTEVISSLSLTIAPGEVHILMGPNGSGKSSLALGLAGHPEYALSGTLTLGEQDLASLNPTERAKKGLFLAMQQPPAIEGVTTGNFLRMAAGEHSAERIDPLAFLKVVKAEAKKVGLPDSFITRYVHVGFSGGEKKRFSLLELRVLKPSFAILDEPDSGLDIDAIKLLQQTVADLSAGGTGFLIITHDTQLARALRPAQVHVLVGGEIAASGGTDVLSIVEHKGYTAFE